MRILLQFSCRCCAPSQPPLCDLHVSTCRRLSRSCIQSPLKFVCLSREGSSSAEFGRSALSPGTADEAENSARNSCCPKQSVQSPPHEHHSSCTDRPNNSIIHSFCRSSVHAPLIVSGLQRSSASSLRFLCFAGRKPKGTDVHSAFLRTQNQGNSKQASSTSPSMMETASCL